MFYIEIQYLKQHVNDKDNGRCLYVDFDNTHKGYFFLGNCNYCGPVFEGCIYYNKYTHMYYYCCSDTLHLLH